MPKTDGWRPEEDALLRQRLADNSFEHANGPHKGEPDWEKIATTHPVLRTGEACKQRARTKTFKGHGLSSSADEEPDKKPKKARNSSTGESPQSSSSALQDSEDLLGDRIVTHLQDLQKLLRFFMNDCLATLKAHLGHSLYLAANHSGHLDAELTAICQALEKQSLQDLRIPRHCGLSSSDPQLLATAPHSTPNMARAGAQQVLEGKADAVGDQMAEAVALLDIASSEDLLSPSAQDDSITNRGCTGTGLGRGTPGKGTPAVATERPTELTTSFVALYLPDADTIPGVPGRDSSFATQLKAKLVGMARGVIQSLSDTAGRIPVSSLPWAYVENQFWRAWSQHERDVFQDWLQQQAATEYVDWPASLLDACGVDVLYVQAEEGPEVAVCLTADVRLAVVLCNIRYEDIYCISVSDCLGRACSQGRVQLARALIERWPSLLRDLNNRSLLYCQPLHAACSCNQIAIVQLLLDASREQVRNGSVSAFNAIDGSRAALRVSCRLGYFECVRLLLEAGVPAATSGGQLSPLSAAMASKKYSCARLLLHTELEAVTKQLEAVTEQLTGHGSPPSALASASSQRQSRRPMLQPQQLAPLLVSRPSAHDRDNAHAPLEACPGVWNDDAVQHALRKFDGYPPMAYAYLCGAHRIEPRLDFRDQQHWAFLRQKETRVLVRDLDSQRLYAETQRLWGEIHLEVQREVKLQLASAGAPNLSPHQLLIFVCNPWGEQDHSLHLNAVLHQALAAQRFVPALIIGATSRSAVHEDRQNNFRTLEQLTASPCRFRYFLFAGHASPETLHFTTSNGQFESPPCGKLAIRNALHEMSVVMLSACYSLEVGKCLQAAGVPVVVCWQTKVQDAAAYLFAREFFRVLQERLPTPDANVEQCERAFAAAKVSVESRTRRVLNSDGRVGDEPYYVLKDPEEKLPADVSTHTYAAGVPCLLRA